MSKAPWTPRRFGKTMVTTLQVLCAVHLVNEQLIEIRPCQGASMYPTLSLQGDYILQSRLLHRLRPLSRGDLVTAISPLDPSHQVLKRVIGLAGDSIIIDPSGERQRQLEIGGGYVAGPKLWGNGTPGETLVVPQGTVWLAGDNVSNSTDSRDYGPLPLGLIRGRVVGRMWPNPSWLDEGFEEDMED